MGLAVQLGTVQFVVDTDEHGPYCVTKFPDGASVLARPIDEPWENVVQHEWTHTWLSFVLGWGPSYVLWKMAHPNEAKDHDRVAYEEAAVLRICDHIKDCA